MIITGLDGKKYSWKITRYNTPLENCSSYHLRVRNLLQEIFPYDRIYEEIVIPGIKTDLNNKSLRADFYIHSHRLMVEVHGEQHYFFNKFFHTNKLEFFRAKKLDSLKNRWCKLNNIKLIILPYHQNDEEWRKTICST
jgi:hypothetical protein